MLTPNGGVFGRNPKFNNVTVEGDLVSTGGATITPNANAPTSNVTIGPSAGALLNDAATNSIAIGSNALDAVLASNANIAIGTNALGALTAGAASITNTTPGTGGTPGTYTGVVLIVESGGTMTVAPTVTLTVAAGGNVSAIVITSPGSGASVQSGIVFRANVAGVPANWRGTLASVTGQCTAVGASALQNNTTGNSNSAVGVAALRSNTTGAFNSAVGREALLNNTTGVGNSAVGDRALQSNTTGNYNLAFGQESLLNNIGGTTNVAVGPSSLRQNTSGSFNTAVNAALHDNTTGSYNVGLGYHAGRYRGASPSTDSLAVANNSIFIGSDSRANADSQTNQIVIGYQAVGDGSNTTVIGNTSTTSTRIPAGNLTLSNGNLILGTAGNGIDFSATANSSGTMTSELLDDYEEGTWTPTINFNGVGTGVTYNFNSGVYTKVGNLVTVTLQITLTSKGSSTGNVRIAGLPFQSETGARTIHSASIALGNVTFADYATANVVQGETYMFLWESSSGNAIANITNADIANDSVFVLTATYFAT